MQIRLNAAKKVFNGRAQVQELGISFPLVIFSIKKPIQYLYVLTLV